jgi:hypothetical protein
VARDLCRFHHADGYEPPWPPSPLPPGGRPPPGVWPPIGVEECCGVDECCDGAAGLWVLPAEGMLGRGAIGGGVTGGRGGAGGAAMGLGAGGAMGLGGGGAIGRGAGGAIGRGAGAAMGLGAGAAALGLAVALRAFGFAFAFLAADFLRALFFATARFFLRATATFFVFFVFFAFLPFAFFDFLVFDFAFFAMIVLPIVSAQIPVRLSVRLKHPCRADICRADRGGPAPAYFHQSLKLAVPQACDLPSPNRSARPCGPPGSPCPPQSG